MTTETAEQLYCSVDLEFTGFDPSRDQILEIGFAFFKLSKKGLEIVEQWDQVFKPTIEVHPKILGLTGITQEELDAAPDFSEYREFLQEKLGNAIIMGHNPVMDVKFLEANGVRLSGKTIDTLELVQFILPTHHSYNLENLVHYFGIKHAEARAAHRALGDALSTIGLLENLMHVYNQFSFKLKTEINEVAERGNFLWLDILRHPLLVKKVEANDSLKISKQLHSLQPLQLSEKLITVDTAPSQHEERVALGLQSVETQTVLVVPDSNTVMRLRKDGLVHGVFKNDDTFSKSAFNAFLEKAETEEELRFCLKIIVWMHTNWQTESVLDLNISFFGGQFRGSIIGGIPKVNTRHKLVCVDYATLQVIKFEKHDIVICDIQNFEKFMSSGFGTRLSWGSVMFALKLIYNPETEFGNSAMKNEVNATLASADLFFGLVYLQLRNKFPNNEYATIDELARNQQYIYKKLAVAADTLREKISMIEQKSKSADLHRIVTFLEHFFELQENRVKWITIDERNLSFQDQPIEIKDNVQSVLKGYSSIRFTDTITNPELLSYYTDRLGLHAEVSEFANKLIPNNISFAIHENALSEDDLYAMSTSCALPLVIIFPNISEVKSFYNDHYQEIKQSAALFAQGYSGGGNKMFRNFSIKENSILLVTADFIAKQNYKINARTIIITKQPPVDATHPYTAALLTHWKKSHPHLQSLFSYAKIVAALKKLKMDNNVIVNLFNFSQENIFVDNTR